MQNGLSFKNTMSRVGLCYFVLMLVTQALQLAGRTLLGSLLETGWGLWALSYAPLYCIAVPVFILLLQKLVPGTPGTAGSAAVKVRRSVPIACITDLDGTGRLDLADIHGLLGALSTGAYPPSQLDYNGDGVFNIADVLYSLIALLEA